MLGRSAMADKLGLLSVSLAPLLTETMTTLDFREALSTQGELVFSVTLVPQGPADAMRLSPTPGAGAAAAALQGAWRTSQRKASRVASATTRGVSKGAGTANEAIKRTSRSLKSAATLDEDSTAVLAIQKAYRSASNVVSGTAHAFDDNMRGAVDSFVEKRLEGMLTTLGQSIGHAIVADKAQPEWLSRNITLTFEKTWPKIHDDLLEALLAQVCYITPT